MSKTTETKFKGLLAQSHRDQFNGKDYQAAAIDIAESNGIAFESDEYTRLLSGPDPACDCGFCATADWAEPDRTEGHDCPAGDIREDDEV